MVSEQFLYTGNVKAHVEILTSTPGQSVQVVDYKSLLDGMALDRFDILVLHYTLRLAVPHYPFRVLQKLRRFKGIKICFLQDEYDHVRLAIGAINYVRFDGVMTCVPEVYIQWVYRGVDFERVVFKRTSTGFIPPGARPNFRETDPKKWWVSYRGRSLPDTYGELGRIKQKIADDMAHFCAEYDVPGNVSALEKDRVYGDDWRKLLRESRAVAITPSGSNVFDFDGRLRARQNSFRSWFGLRRPGQIREMVDMAQASPRMFEALLEGAALVAHEDYVPPPLRGGKDCLTYSDAPGSLEQLKADLGNPGKLAKIRASAWATVTRSGEFNSEILQSDFASLIKILSSREPAQARSIALKRRKMRPRFVNRFIVNWLAADFSMFLYRQARELKALVIGSTAMRGVRWLLIGSR